MKVFVKKAVVMAFVVAMVMTVSIGMARSQNYVNELSPPIIKSPIYDGAEIVGVADFTHGAEITIYANDVEEIGKGSFWFGRWMFKVDRKLKEGDKITATQTVNGDTSYPTRKPVIVQELPADVLNNEALGRPSIIPPLYDCQRIVPVKDLLEGAKVYVFSDGTLIGRAETPYGVAYVGTHELIEKDKIKANQSICGEFSGEFSSPLSYEEIVKSKPTSLPPPVVDNKSLVDGGNTVVVTGLTTGALVDIYSDDTTRIGGGIAPAPGVIFPVNPPLKKGSKITANQSLCEVKSDSSSPKVVKDFLNPPMIEEPICEGSISVTICNTALNAILKIYVNGKQAGQGGATGNCTTLYLGDKIILKDGDKVNATQTIGTVTSKHSDTVTVVAFISDPIVEVKNGHPFFKPEPGEQTIPGPVFLRGVLTTGTYGPAFKAVMCGAKKVVVEIIDPHGEKIETIPLVETKPGFFEGGWDWKHTGWKIPDDIPVGEYKARFEVTSSAGKKIEEKVFYVIFNPAEVTASSAFALSDKGEKGIWFNVRYGADYAIQYVLHPDDNRIFSRAIKEINGETSQENAAKKLLSFEKGMLGWSLVGQKPYDVIYLIEIRKEAQCADDANVLTALLRSVGIPAHPTTGDFALEHGPVKYRFDTWMEARYKGVSGEQWYALHPHEGSGLGPDKRDTAGTTWDVASKESNDVIIMAMENWNKEVDDKINDLEFGYDADCKEPNQKLKQAAWLDHLCLPGPSGIGYWGKGHWTCSPPQESSITISLDRERYYVGDDIRVNVTIDNPTTDSIASELVVDIVAYHPWDMAGEEVLKELRENITIEPGRSQTIRTSYRLPLTLSSADGYSVRATFAREYATAPFAVSPLFEGDLALPDHVEEGEKFVAELTIANPQRIPLRDISAKLDLPFEVQSLEETLYKKIDELEPSAKEVLVWKLSARSHTVAASLEFTIESDTSGGAQLSKGMVILPTYLEDPVVPYAPMRPEAKFKLGNLSVPASVRTGETITIKIDITNIGEALDSTTVNLKINDTVIGFKEVTLDVGETKTVEFTHTAEDEPGTYSVEVDGKTSEYVVTPGFEVVFAIAGLLAVAYLLRRKK